MGSFSPETKSRAWVSTIQIGNMKKAGLKQEEYENYELLADFLSETWEQSGKGRVCAVSICYSKKDLYHVHMALYGNTTTLKKVAKILFDSHVEPQLSGKKTLTAYMLKEPPYDEKGETILFTKGLENIQDKQGLRSDLEIISDLLNRGCTPGEIFEEKFSNRRFEKMIKSAYVDKRFKEIPLIKENMNCTWVVGDSGVGKTYSYYQLCEKYGPENVYLATDHNGGGLDFYTDQGCPSILFLDEFKGNMKFSELLTLLDKYSRAQIHCRYINTYCLWTTVVITSIFPPDEVYSYMVDDDKKGRDKIDQLLRRLNTIEYRYVLNGEYKTYSIPAKEYTTYEDLKHRALSNK